MSDNRSCIVHDNKIPSFAKRAIYCAFRWLRFNSPEGFCRFPFQSQGTSTSRNYDTQFKTRIGAHFNRISKQENPRKKTSSLDCVRCNQNWQNWFFNEILLNSYWCLNLLCETWMPTAQWQSTRIYWIDVSRFYSIYPYRLTDLSVNR